MIKAVLTELKSSGKIVYMFYTYTVGVDWVSIISDPICLDGHIAPMITYVKDNQIDGIMLGLLGLHVSYILCYEIIIMYS